MSDIVQFYNLLKSKFQANPTLYSTVYSQLLQLKSGGMNQDISSDKGYCFKYTLPEAAVSKIFSVLNIDKTELKGAFLSEFGHPVGAYMLNDSYYHILMLLIYYGIRENDEKLINNAYFVLFMKLWNGRLDHYFPKFCDPNTMNYVVNVMMSKRYHLAKPEYNSPSGLIEKYFIPSILSKYAPEILKSPKNLQRLFSQSWNRLTQLYYQNPIYDQEKGRKIAQSGILPLYMQAVKEGRKMTNPSIRNDDDNESDFSDFATTNSKEELAKNIADFITLNPKPKYSLDFVNMLNGLTKVKSSHIEGILKALHDHNYHDNIRDIVILIISRTDVKNRTDICQPNYFATIKKQVISSKNNSDVNKLTRILDNLIEDIFENKLNLGKSYTEMSVVFKMNIRNVIIYGVVNSMRKLICQRSE